MDLLSSNFSRRAFLKLSALSGGAAFVSLTGCGSSGGSGGGSVSNTNRVSPLASSFTPDVAIQWMTLARDLVKAQRLSPPVASRAFGYAGVALHEAVVPGVQGGVSLEGQLNGLTSVPDQDPDAQYHWPAVANAALAVVFAAMFKTNAGVVPAEIAAKETAVSNTFAGVAADVLQRSVTHGRAIGDAIVAWAAADGFAGLGSMTFTPPTGPGMWVPTAPAFAPNPLQPHWGTLRPFVIQNINAMDAPAPPAFSTDLSSAFYQEALEVYNTVKNLTPEQRAIALFWADDAGVPGTPPGHSIGLVEQIVTQTTSRLDKAAEAYARVGIAIADAFISAWHTKYIYNLMRPISYIQQVIDPAFTAGMMPLNTPPFPEYTSGHSVQTSAAMTALSGLYSNNTLFVDHTHDGRGLAPRTFGSFNAVATEAAYSRLYGGIHYRSGIEAGMEQGRAIGNLVKGLRFRV
jgi:hypothetical protein